MNNCKRRVCSVFLFGIFFISFVSAQNPLVPDYSLIPKRDWERKFDAFTFNIYKEKGHMLPYRFYAPENIERDKEYPLVIFFHGAGEKGYDNRTQFRRFNPVKFWEKYPCYVLAPECPEKTKSTTNAESAWGDAPYGARVHQMRKEATFPMQLAMSLIAEIIQENQVDKQRIYVTGLSMGGFATWEIIQRESEWFASAIPVCGGGDMSYAPKLRDVSIWAFHGLADQTVPVECSQDMVAAIRKAGGNPKYTEYRGVAHDAWTSTYANPEVWDWLFRQVR